MTTRAEFIADLIRKSTVPVPLVISEAKGTAYRVQVGDAPMNCRTCSARTTGRVTLASGEPVVRCPECFQRVGYDDPGATIRP